MENLDLEEKKDLLYFIEKLISLDAFWNANYYLRCLKKLPHGGVVSIECPNFFLHYFRFRSYELFIKDPEKIPLFIENLISIAVELYEQCEVDLEELIKYCFSNDNWYSGMRLLHPKPEFAKTNISTPIICTVIEKNLRYQDYFSIDIKLIIYALIVRLVEEGITTISNVEEIIAHEKLSLPHNKYGLVNITNADFLRQGFILGEKFYLYSIFLDTSIGHPTDIMPYTIRIITNESRPVQIYMRCDENLAVPVKQMLSTATVDAEKFHGITVDFANIESLIFHKEIVVHIHPETQHKILLKINPGEENGQRFFHIGVEELWNPETIRDNVVATNFIHAKYYPDSKSFNHIDFSINQYSIEVFAAKYKEALNQTGVPVDKFGDLHYKVWCIEGENISIPAWSYLVCATLDEPFREIFLEIFHQ
jgi:hypothetical protein